jgi:hypothetical protein
LFLTIKELQASSADVIKKQHRQNLQDLPGGMHARDGPSPHSGQRAGAAICSEIAVIFYNPEAEAQFGGAIRAASAERTAASNGDEISARRTCKRLIIYADVIQLRDGGSLAAQNKAASGPAFATPGDTNAMARGREKPTPASRPAVITARRR